jgi:hypothetical protein
MKIFKTLAAALMGAAMALGLSTSASADGHGYGKQKVVYHVNYYDAKRQTGPCAIFRTTSMPLGPKTWTCVLSCMETVFRFSLSLIRSPRPK